MVLTGICTDVMDSNMDGAKKTCGGGSFKFVTSAPKHEEK